MCGGWSSSRCSLLDALQEGGGGILVRGSFRRVQLLTAKEGAARIAPHAPSRAPSFVFTGNFSGWQGRGGLRGEHTTAEASTPPRRPTPAATADGLTEGAVRLRRSPAPRAKRPQSPAHCNSQSPSRRTRTATCAPAPPPESRRCRCDGGNGVTQTTRQRPQQCHRRTGGIPPCDIPSGCCSFTGPWTVTRSSLRVLRRVAAFCRPLRPVLLLVLFPRSRCPVVGVLGLC